MTTESRPAADPLTRTPGSRLTSRLAPTNRMCRPSVVNAIR
jgi:hypothetical protein